MTDNWTGLDLICFDYNDILASCPCQTRITDLQARNQRASTSRHQDRGYDNICDVDKADITDGSTDKTKKIHDCEPCNKTMLQLANGKQPLARSNQQWTCYLNNEPVSVLFVLVLNNKQPSCPLETAPPLPCTLLLLSPLLLVHCH
jgi:hypothetical protein